MQSWPAHGDVVRPWRQTARRGSRDDRTFSQVTARVPPHIADLTVPTDAALALEMESALGEIVALDQVHGPDLDALGVLLLRTESVASSKIEHVEASMDDFARALHGSKANASATSMVAATAALGLLMTAIDRDGRVALSDLLVAHAALMRDDPLEGPVAGRLRVVQNWVGGNDHSPRNALYIPPPPEMVSDLMADLIRFANRSDLPVLGQAAIAHAQLESIHPFTDGNGRIGRALINAVLRRRCATTRVVVPLASALVAHRNRYFGDLDRYREGDVRPIIISFARASKVAAAESRATARRLAEIPGEWAEMAGPSRAGSTAAAMIPWLLAHPVFSADEAVTGLGAPVSSVYQAIERLHRAGVLGPLTDRKRGQVWGAGLVLDELDDLGVRIARAAP